MATRLYESYTPAVDFLGVRVAHGDVVTSTASAARRRPFVLTAGRSGEDRAENGIHECCRASVYTYSTYKMMVTPSAACGSGVHH